MSKDTSFQLQCPMPIREHDRVQLAHGSGGSLMHTLIDGLIKPVLQNEMLAQNHDGAVLGNIPGKMAFTTDSYVVTPHTFPGGDIGTLAVYGTVNDLAMSGARPMYLSLGLILEEGLLMQTLHRILVSIRQAADRCGVLIVTGDTKVVDRGKGDGLYINTAGVGEVLAPIQPERIQPGDAVLINGDIARHGITIMSAREGLAFDSPIESDCAPLHETVAALIQAGIDIHALRDMTRGGMSTTMVELAQTAGVQIALEEALIPVLDPVRGACEMLGFDPLYVANEGRMAVIVPGAEKERALEVMQATEEGRHAVYVGSVLSSERPIVTLKSPLGTSRVLDMLSGEQLPRIC